MCVNSLLSVQFESLYHCMRLTLDLTRFSPFSVSLFLFFQAHGQFSLCTSSHPLSPFVPSSIFPFISYHLYFHSPFKELVQVVSPKIILIYFFNTWGKGIMGKVFLAFCLSIFKSLFFLCALLVYLCHPFAFLSFFCCLFHDFLSFLSLLGL